MTAFAAGDRSVDGGGVRLELCGDLRGAVVNQVATLILDAVVVDLVDELIVDLDGVGFVDTAGLRVLLGCYEVAIECGTLYRVINAHGQVHDALAAIGMVDVLADSEDIGAVLLALAILPDPGGPDEQVNAPSGRVGHSPEVPRAASDL